MPRGLQTWLLAGLAAFMLLVMFVVGRPDAPAPAAPQVALGGPASADRVRDYQDRLRALETQGVAQPTAPPAAPLVDPNLALEPPSSPVADPIDAERRRRDYESLFASNVVQSRRPASERPDSGRVDPLSQAGPAGAADLLPMDATADAALLATVRAASLTGAPVHRAPTAVPIDAPTPRGPTAASSSSPVRVPERTDPISATGPLHRLLEGTIVEAVLTTRLDGATAAPVTCLVTHPLYSHSGRHVVIPAGARLLGTSTPVQSVGETRLAVAFHRLVMPDGRTYRLDQSRALNQRGDAGLHDRVNHHYVATFGSAAAVGLISGLSQLLGSAGLSRGEGDRTVIIAGGVSDATSQATLQVMNRFLNRLPTVTIREGHRVKVYLMSDVELPAYVAPGSPASF
jgi:type IV secretion system protein VirB10